MADRYHTFRADRRVFAVMTSGYRCDIWLSIFLKGLILAQNERWRRGLGMQVEREFEC